MDPSQSNGMPAIAGTIANWNSFGAVANGINKINTQNQELKRQLLDQDTRIQNMSQEILRVTGDLIDCNKQNELLETSVATLNRISSRHQEDIRILRETLASTRHITITNSAATFLLVLGSAGAIVYKTAYAIYAAIIAVGAEETARITSS